MMVHKIFEYGIHTFAMSRSGHHAVQNWVASHFPQPHKVHNNQHISNPRFVGGFGKHSRTLVTNFENYSPKAIATALDVSGDYIKTRTKRGCICFDQRTIVVLRDPYNMLASRIKHPGFNLRYHKIVTRWVEYADEYLGITNYLPEDTVHILYNRWFHDSDYRKRVTEQLNAPLPPDDTVMSVVTRAGGGSSFEQRNLDGRAQEMDVLRLWQTLRENANMKKLLADNEVRKKVDKIFTSTDIGEV